MKKVSIIGAGQLGSRHLQGLKNAQAEMEIWVIDACEESLKVAKERCDLVESTTPKIIHYANNMEALPKALDLVIVATGSKPRATIVKTLLNHATVSYLVLEKFLFTSLQEYDDIETLLKEKEVNCWVNCPRRMWESYGEIKNLINPKEAVTIEYNGQNWGLCCNTVHYIDLWMYLAGDCDFTVDLSGVESQIIESKRNGYIELLGKELFVSDNGDVLKLGSFSAFNGESNVIIHNAGNELLIDEGKGQWIFNDDVHLSKTPFQSNLTGIVADEILLSGECRLTPYGVSVKYHKPYLQSIIQFVNKLQGIHSVSCPIT